MSKSKAPLLTKLAHLYGVQTTYYDVDKIRHQASPEALLFVLRALGAPLEDLNDVPDAVRERQSALWKRCVEPVSVAWDGQPQSIELRLPINLSNSPIAYSLRAGESETHQSTFDLRQQSPSQTTQIEGETFVTKRLSLPNNLPWGYYQLSLEVKGNIFDSMIISAARKAYHDESTGRTWGGFLPLYALHSKKSWGAGDFSDLEALMERIANHGGGVVGTLPLLASFLSEPFDPSPYSPASRQFWNEFYIDVTRVPELRYSPEAQSIIDSEAVNKELQALRSSRLVDYRRLMALKRKVLETLSRSFFSSSSERRQAFELFVEAHPEAADYARFRALCERHRTPWSLWPEPLKNGFVNQGDYDQETKLYYLYTQWLAHEQILSISEKARKMGQGLYLDFPLGVHPDGYDTWRENDAFASETSVGAPPDTFFTKGQNWGFPPLCPHRLRTQNYRYLIDCLRHHLRAAGILRIDHVMALHRLFWVPNGLEASQGVYVRYNAEELYAILSLESHLHKSWIVGENLGTVPYYVNPTMHRHNIHKMYVLQYETAPDLTRPVRMVGANSVASINTHDMPTFSAFWKSLDVEDREDLGLLSKAGARFEQKNRETTKQALVGFLERKGYLSGPATEEKVLRACLAYLSTSHARVVLVNLEDLWLETKPQNVPGTHKERPNWQRKAAYSLETFWELPQVLETLKELNQLRSRGEE